MPQIGDLRNAGEIGRAGANKFVWVACIDCRKERWVKLLQGKATYSRCYDCKKENQFTHSANNPCWRGGRRYANGYISILLGKEDFFSPTADLRGYIKEHRLVMARHLGRNLHSFEIIHHKNGIRDDNRLENLELTTSGAHHIAHHKGYKDGFERGLIDGRTKQIQLLKQEIERLRLQIAERS